MTDKDKKATRMFEEAFAEDDIERTVDIGYDPKNLFVGNPEVKEKAWEKFRENHEKAKNRRN